MTLRQTAKFIVLAMAAAFLASDSASACCKAQFERNKPHVNVGTIGHVDRNKRSGQTTVIGGILSGAGSTHGRTHQELLIMVTPQVTAPAK